MSISEKSKEDIRCKIIETIRESISDAIDDLKLDLPGSSELNEYKRIISERIDFPLIITDEQFTGIELFGGVVVIIIMISKDKINESRRTELDKYILYYPLVRCVVLTNGDVWRYFKASGSNLVEYKPPSLKSAIEDVLKNGVKIVPTTKNIKDLFRSVLLKEDDFAKIFDDSDTKSSPLFAAYKSIMELIYDKKSDNQLKSLFIKHTLMQMIVSACLTAALDIPSNPLNACLGSNIDVEIALPYLKWWSTMPERNADFKKVIVALAESVYSKALILDWKHGNRSDVFRELYEILIDSETRKILGEYYTPIWLAEFMIHKLANNQFKGKLVFDPFCGSGTFLVASFYKKCDEGEPPEKAIQEIIGFDVNPLAVSISRAELMIAYQYFKTGEIMTPRVFHTNSIAILLQSEREMKPVSFFRALRGLESRILGLMGLKIYLVKENDFTNLLELETFLRASFKTASKFEQSDSIQNSLRESFRNFKCIITGGGNKLPESKLIMNIINELSSDVSVSNFASLIKSYGNGVWAISIVSLFAPFIIKEVKPDITITNPPWILLTRLKGVYGKIARLRITKLIGDEYKKTSQIINASNLSIALLDGCIRNTKSKIIFVMPSECVYSAGLYSGLGKICTFEAVKNYSCRIVQINFDVFKHGAKPTIVMVDKKPGFKCCYSLDIIKYGAEYTKSVRLQDIVYSIEKTEPYTKYIDNVVRYVKTPVKTIRETLKVERIKPTGLYIRGIFGGASKKIDVIYAGLVFEIINKDETRNLYSIKLANLTSIIDVPEQTLKKYWKKMVYFSDIFPFYLNGIRNILLSSESKDKLKAFIRDIFYENNNITSLEDKEKIKLLIDEIQQPSKIETMSKTKYYVIYRRVRAFASVVMTLDDITLFSKDCDLPIVIYESCAYLVLNYETPAFYYSSILNYLVFRTSNAGTFFRSQFTRPLLAIIKANLVWKGLDWQVSVANLGKEIQNKAMSKLRNAIKPRMRIKESFKELLADSEIKNLFLKLVKLIDTNTDENNLSDAMTYVAKMKKTKTP